MGNTPKILEWRESWIDLVVNRRIGPLNTTYSQTGGIGRMVESENDLVVNRRRVALRDRSLFTGGEGTIFGGGSLFLELHFTTSL